MFTSNRVVIAGLAFLALAMCGCLLLVATKLFGAATGACTAGVALVVFAGVWFAIPLARLRALERGNGVAGRDRRGARALPRTDVYKPLTWVSTRPLVLVRLSNQPPNRRKGTKPCGKRTQFIDSCMPKTGGSLPAGVRTSTSGTAGQ